MAEKFDVFEDAIIREKETLARRKARREIFINLKAPQEIIDFENRLINESKQNLAVLMGKV